MNISKHKTPIMIGLLVIAASAWAYHFSRIEIVFPPSHVDGLLVCAPEYNPNPGGLSEQENAVSGETYYQRHLESLTTATDPDTHVVATVNMHSLNVGERIDSLTALLTQFPDNRLANLQFLNACAENAQHPACDENSVLRANGVNADNGISWSLLAIYLGELGDDPGVDRAMVQAATVQGFDDYFSTQVRILRDALPEEGSQRLGLAWNIVTRGRLSLNNGHQTAELCTVDDPARGELLSACLDFGQRMQEESQSLLMRSVGGAIRQVAYNSLGDTAAAERMENEYFASQRARSAADSQWSRFNRVGSLMSYDADLLMYWMDELIEFGETDLAVANTIALAERLSADPDYAPCKSPRPEIRSR